MDSIQPMQHRLLIMAATLSFLAGSAPGASPEEGIRFPGVTLRPSMDGAMTWDSNIWLANENGTGTSLDAGPATDGGSATDRRKVVSDMFYSLGLSLAAAVRSDTLRASADAWGRLQSYMDTGARDSKEFGERLQLGFGERRAMSVSLYQRFASVDQYDRGPIGRDLQDPGDATSSLTDPTLRERAALSRHTSLDFGADLGRDLTDKMTGDLRYLFTMTEYDESPADLGVEAWPVLVEPVTDEEEILHLNNTREQRLAAELGWKATDKTSFTITGEGALQDSDGFENPAILLAARVGAVTRTSEKFQFRGGIGVMHYTYDSYGTNAGPTRVNPLTGDRERIPAESETSAEPSFELGAAWAPTDRWQIQASAFSGFQPSVQYSGNAIYNTMAMIGVGFRITRDLSLTVGGGLRMDEYLGSVRIADPEAEDGTREIDKTVDLYTLNARLDYRPADSFWAVYADVRENNASSNDPAAVYDATQVSAGITAWY